MDEREAAPPDPLEWTYAVRPVSASTKPLPRRVLGLSRMRNLPAQDSAPRRT